MPNPELLPVDQWVVPEGEGHYRLQHPTGEAYDPGVVPGWLGRAGLDFLMAHNDSVRLTILYNKQQTSTDLGAQGEFERLASMATMLVDGVRKPSEGSQQDQSYLQRRSNAVSKALVLDTHSTGWIR